MEGIVLTVAILLTVVIIAAESAIGCVRGWKLTLIRFGENAVGALLALPISGAIARPLASALLKSTDYGDAEGIISELLYSKDFSSGSVTELAGLLDALITGITAAVVYIGVFWLLKLLLWVINRIVFAVICKNKEQPTVDKKSHIIGFVCGVAGGLICAAITFMPLTELTKSLLPLKESGVVSEMPKEAAELLEAVDIQPLSTVFTYTATEIPAGAIWKCYTQGGEVKLNETVAFIADCYIEMKKYEDAGKTTLSETADTLEQLAGFVKSADLVSDNVKLDAVGTFTKNYGITYEAYADFDADLAILIDLMRYLGAKGANEDLILMNIEDCDKTLFDSETLTYTIDGICRTTVCDKLMNELLTRLLNSFTGDYTIKIEMSGVAEKKADIITAVNALLDLEDASKGDLTDMSVLKRALADVDAIKATGVFSSGIVDTIAQKFDVSALV